MQVVIEEGPEDGEREEGPVLSNEDCRAVLEGGRSPEDMGIRDIPMGLNGEVGDWELTGGVFVPGIQEKRATPCEG
jgi:hypothetical protein